MSFYKVRGLSPALDGLTVEGDKHGTTVTVTRIINPNVMLGDRTLSFPVEPYGLHIRSTFLEPIDNPQLREFTHTNPWGKCLFEGVHKKDNLEVAVARFENAVQVTVTEKVDGVNKTLWTEYFHQGPDASTETLFARVTEIIGKGLSAEGDASELVFTLRHTHDAYERDYDDGQTR